MKERRIKELEEFIALHDRSETEHGWLEYSASVAKCFPARKELSEWRLGILKVPPLPEPEYYI